MASARAATRDQDARAAADHPGWVRQLVHKLIGIAFWILLVGCWVALWATGRVGAGNLTYSVQYVAIIAGAVLAVTVWWIRHNVRIHAKKGPRGLRPPEPPRTDEALAPALARVHRGRPLRDSGQSLLA